MEGVSVDWKALGYGLATFVASWILVAIVASTMAAAGIDAYGGKTIQVMGNLAPVVAGYVAAMKATRRRLVHGIVGGAIGVVPVMVFPMLFADTTYSMYAVLLILTCFALLAALGAVIANHFAKRRAA